jgi:hypothetical protein
LTRLSIWLRDAEVPSVKTPAKLPPCPASTPSTVRPLAVYWYVAASSPSPERGVKLRLMFAACKLATSFCSSVER